MGLSITAIPKDPIIWRATKNAIKSHVQVHNFCLGLKDTSLKTSRSTMAGIAKPPPDVRPVKLGLGEGSEYPMSCILISWPDNIMLIFFTACLGLRRIELINAILIKNPPSILLVFQTELKIKTALQ